MRSGLRGGCVECVERACGDSKEKPGVPLEIQERISGFREKYYSFGIIISNMGKNKCETSNQKDIITSVYHSIYIIYSIYHGILVILL